MKTLKDLFLDELEDIYDTERRIVQALPKFAEAATCPDLREAIQSHQKRSEAQVRKLDQIFKSFGAKAKGKTCEAAVELLEEEGQIAAQFKGSPAINAALVSAEQMVEDYEMASYNCLHEWAEVLRNKEAAKLLKQIVDEERRANESLDKLAHSSMIQKGFEEWNRNAGKESIQAAHPHPSEQPLGIQPANAGCVHYS